MDTKFTFLLIQEINALKWHYAIGLHDMFPLSEDERKLGLAGMVTPFIINLHVPSLFIVTKHTSRGQVLSFYIITPRRSSKGLVWRFITVLHSYRWALMSLMYGVHGLLHGRGRPTSSYLYCLKKYQPFNGVYSIEAK